MRRSGLARFFDPGYMSQEAARDLQLKTLERRALGEKGLSWLGREQYRSSECVPDLVAFLSVETDFRRQLRGVSVLAHLGSPEAIAALLVELQSTRARGSRAALRAVRNLKPPPSSAGPVLVKVLAEDNARRVELAASALAKIGDTSAVDDLRRTAARESLPKLTRTLVAGRANVLERQAQMR
jgi:HEAT repeat protein